MPMSVGVFTMRRSNVFAAAAVSMVAACAFADLACADMAPVIVIPSRPGVPVVINGRDASYAVVEGDWGLARPGAVPVTVIGGSPIRANPVYEPRGAYHPRYGRTPERGRREVESPNERPLAEAPEPIFRSWSASSAVQPANDRPGRSEPGSSSYDPDSVPATITDPATYPRNFEPPVIVAPRRRHHN